MKLALAFTAVGVLAFLAGSALWLGSRAGIQAPEDPVAIAPAALYSASFRDESGAQQPLGRFQGRIVVVNFWATWCTPCLKEMPAFARLHSRWNGRGVQFLGLSEDDPEAVRRFSSQLAISYPLWTGGVEVTDFARRLGNRIGVLPFSVILGRNGEILERRVGPYTEDELETRLAAYSSKSG